MQINQIRYFLAMCVEGSFTRAARSCGVAQPTVTNGIKALEQALGGSLFCRKRQITLTALGEAVRPHLDRIMEEVDLARAAAAGPRRESRGLAGECVDQYELVMNLKTAKEHGITVANDVQVLAD